MAMAKSLVSGSSSSKAIAAKHTPAAKKHAAKKHPAKKHAAKKPATPKHAGKEAKHAGKKAAKKAAKHLPPEGIPAKTPASPSPPSYGKRSRKLLTKAFHHLQRASAVISLIEPESGGDLKVLLHHGVQLYRDASQPVLPNRRLAAERAYGLLAAAEHLAMAGLYAARGVHQLDVDFPSTEKVEERFEELGSRLEKASRGEGGDFAERLQAIALELLRRAEAAGFEAEIGDPHLAYELVMAADGLCLVLEAGPE